MFCASYQREFPYFAHEREAESFMLGRTDKLKSTQQSGEPGWPRKLDTFTPSALCEARLEPAPRAREAAAAFSSNADEQLPDELLAELRTAAKPSQ